MFILIATQRSIELYVSVVRHCRSIFLYLGRQNQRSPKRQIRLAIASSREYTEFEGKRASI
ncbi:hypothetical protein [Myxosarcina sp. GI1]|uniref:hypothetical protein n=1 Tax=Myxosarcina sp. GI1 TaxID=1541065 RepID=UPI0012E02B18|nr:hypothetical protein [Myxosarcina sp. GI1]